MHVGSQDGAGSRSGSTTRHHEPVSTRKLILAALLCGVAILAASAIQLIIAQ
jgi:hypothetical protein